LFTYIPNPGAGVSTDDSFSYTIIDMDGDTATATVTITLDADSEPSITVTDGVVDEKGLPEGSSEQADGDRSNNSDTSETTTGSFSLDTGNDSVAAVEIQDGNGNWIDVTAAETVQGANGR
jgi:hypothetical protein